MGKRINTAKWLSKQNRWQIKVQKDGLRKTFTSSTPGRKGMRECHKKADEWLDDNIVNTRITVSKLSEMYMEEKFLSVGTNRQKGIKSNFNKWINPRIGSKRVYSLTEQNLQDILNDMFKSGSSKKTITELKIILCDFIKYARKNNLTKLYPENLTVNRFAPKNPPRQSMDRNDSVTLFQSDLTRYKGKVVKDKWIYAYRFLVLTGLRRGEMLGLQWEDVKEHTIEIKRAINEYKEVTEGKTANAIRTIPLTADIKALLDQVPKKSGWIFWDGCRPATVTYRFKQYVKHNNLTVNTLHELRHTFITLYDDILPINTVKSIVGHSKNMKTVDVYGHMTEEQMEKARGIMEKEMENIIKIG